MQKYWLMKYKERYYNCFMLYATYLSLHVLEDDSYQKPMDSCWEWSQIKESDGASIMVGKIEQPPNNILFDVRGEFNTEYLSLGVTYKIAFVVMLPLAAPEQHKFKQPAICFLHLPRHFEAQEYDLNDKPRGEWIRLLVGKFKTSLANIGKMTFSLEEYEYGLVIKGVAIEPILNQEAEESGWSRKGLKLPQNIGAIIDQCDSRIDKSSISKFCDQLIVGVFLNKKKQKYWLIKYNEHYYNCFMLYATYLSVLVSEDLHGDCLPGLHNCWELNQMEESDGASIMVGKILQPSYDTLFFVSGHLDTDYLSLGVAYEIAFVVMLPLAAPEEHKFKQPAICYLSDPWPLESHEYDLNDKPRGEWIRLFVGKFKTSLENIRRLTFCLKVEYGLVIKGIVIEPIV